MSEPRPAPASRRRFALWTGAVAVLAVLVAGLAIVLTRDGGDHGDRDADRDREAAAACPEHYHRLTGADPDAGEEGEPGEEEGVDADRPDADHEDADADEDADRPLGPCWRDGAPLPEQLADLTRLNDGAAAVMGFDDPAAMSVAQKQAAQLGRVRVPHSRGTWVRVSNGLLDERDPNYPAGGYGNTVLAGRMTGYSLGPRGVVYAGVANGGVWKSPDRGRHWQDIGLHLPSQIVGAIGWSRAGGKRGTLFALTGDNSFGQYNWAGSGMFYSTDEGRHWRHARGIPSGLLAFKVEVAPDSPNTVYAATGGGLYRSTNAGRSFVNVKLPTVSGCWLPKRMFTERCALSSIVTDVIVRGKDSFGHSGGAVVAAVGWRAGNQKNADGVPQAPANGLYESANGATGSFRKLPDTSGFTPASHVGRVSFGNAYGPAQNHDYLYALVQDSVLLQKGGIQLLPSELDNGVTSNFITSYVEGAYVSKDFGKTWTKMMGTTQFVGPQTGSSLAALEPLGIAPGVQAWYNNWIQPDPYTQIGGVPTNVMLGLEEIYQTATAGTPQDGPTMFQVVAPYAGGTYVCVLAGSPCSLTLQKSGITSAHPDQHGFLFLPPNGGQREVLATSDGGNYVAKLPAAGLFKQTDWKSNQAGFNTLIPYSFDVSHDGTVVDGMQDNGSMVWRPGWRAAKETYPGDGGTTLIDPKNSQNMIISLAIGSSLYLNTQGGKGDSVLNGNDVTPDVGTRYTYGLLGRDDKKPTRIIYAGRKVAIADTPLTSLTTSSWKTVFDLGTRRQPGNAKAEPSVDNPELQASANDIYNGTAYVGYCGTCQTITGAKLVGTGGSTFSSGIATNYGGKWHIAKAKGLPDRLVNAVYVDRKHPNVVYAGLGVSTKRQAFNPGATGRDGVTKRGGFLYVSTDGGNHFRDITGKLPRVGVLALSSYQGQLLVGSTLGLYIGSKTTMRKVKRTTVVATPRYARLGSNLPAIAITQMKFRPGYARQLYVSTYGRGIYRLNLHK